MEAGTAVIGRDAELERIQAFVESVSDGSGALLIEGEAGAGKTTLWLEGRARTNGDTTVLSCRPVHAEATLSFAGLGDLLGGVLDGVLDQLPPPQRRGLEAALLLDDAGRSDHRAVGAATLSTLRVLSRDGPVLLAIDDVQWLDRPSGRALAFALRRLDDEPVRLLGALRAAPPGGAPPLELVEALEVGRTERIVVSPLSVGAVERLLSERLDIKLPRTVLLRLHETSRGNALFALELGRALAESEARPGPGEPLPVPDDLHELLLKRVRRLPADAREAHLLASLLSQATEDTLARAVGPSWEGALERGREAGIIEVGGGSVRFTHPLLASALAASASSGQRRRAHARLAAAVNDQEERARHLALAATEPDEEVATALEHAAEHARRRGAPDAAAELAELSRALTPPGHPHDVWRRCRAAGDARFAAGDSALAAELFAEAVDAAARGPERAGALQGLARTHVQHDDVAGAERLLEEALEEAGDDPMLRAAIEHDIVYPIFAAGDLARSLEHARVAAALAERVGADHFLAGALCQIAVIEFLMGHGLHVDLMDRARDLENWDIPRPAALRPSSITAHVLSWSGRIDEARTLVLDGERELVERGDEGSLPWVWYRLAELDCWSGDWARGYERARAADQLAIQTGQGAIRPPTCYAVALLAAHLGQVEEARDAAQQGIAAAAAAGLAIGLSANLGVLGFVEHSLGQPDRAHEIWGPLLAAMRRGGLDEPGLLWWLPDEIEALVALGRHDEAASLIAWLDERARAIDRPAGLAAGARGRALLLAADGNSAEALEACDDALRHDDRAGLPFPRGRTLLAKGQIARRARRWGVARESLEGAHAVFEELGAELWAEKARDELGRIGGRQPAAPLELSEGERQIAELVAQGRTNREVAEVLFVSPRTVSASLARIYRKLGVKTRTEMAALLRQ